KKLLVIDADETKQAIEETISIDKRDNMWKKMFEDPNFIEVFYKSVEDEHKKFMEKLLADPAIKEKVMEILEDPKMTDQFEKLMKSTTYKEHLKKVIEETYETRTFKKRTHDIMKKIVEEKDKDENKKKEKSQKEEAPDDEEIEKEHHTSCLRWIKFSYQKELWTWLVKRGQNKNKEIYGLCQN